MNYSLISIFFCLILWFFGCVNDEMVEETFEVAVTVNEPSFAVMLTVAENPCTVDTCDDGNPCTIDTCDTAEIGQCVYTLKGWDCWPCQVDSDCQIGMVTCQEDGKIHEDGYGVCLQDKTCETFHKTKSCDDNNPCTIDGCSTEDDFVFCENSQVTCDDDNPCTIDTCDIITGKCSYEQSGKCGIGGGQGPLCKVEADCDDGNPCTADPCWEGECWGHAFGCDDGNPCTNDFCKPGKVCGHQVIPGCKQ